MTTSKCPNCSEPYVDEHGHGLCFGCKVKGLTFASVRQGPSVWALEKQAVEDARAVGIEPERYDGPPKDRRSERNKRDGQAVRKIAAQAIELRT